MNMEEEHEHQLEHRIHRLGKPICTLRRLLTKTDAALDQARLQITYDEARGLLHCADVTDGEKALMADPDRKLQMAAYDRHGNQYRMGFSKVRGKGVYRLTGDFAKFLRNTGLQKGHTLVMWVVRRPPPPETGEKDGTLAMVLFDYKTTEPEEVEELEKGDREALEAASTLCLLNSSH